MLWIESWCYLCEHGTIEDIYYYVLHIWQYKLT